MIITRTPFRVSFFGGGSDYPAYFRRHGGATLATAIDKYVYVTVQPLSDCFDHRIKVHYSRVEAVKTLDDLRIPNVREALRLLDIERGVEIHLVSDLPARTGLGTSSATTVGLLKALHAYRGELVSEAELAGEAVHVEQEMIRERVGNQDQYITAFGGFRHLRFLPDKTLAEPLPVARARIEQLHDRLIMLYTGLQRMAGEVVTEQLERTRNGDLDDSLRLMKEEVAEGIDILTRNRPLSGFGDLLHQAWQLKRSLSSRVSTPWVDEVYDKARAAGALGGKLLGAGSGGFLLLYVEPGRRTAVRAALSNLREVQFNLEPEGTRLIYYVC